MTTVLPSKQLSISIERPATAVYEFAANPENLPRWAAGLCKSVKKSAGDWIVQTPQGPLKIRFAPKNDLGVLDHYVAIGPGAEVYVPMRAVANGAGSEVIFTIFRSPGMSDEKFEADVGFVEKDLKTLKLVLEADR